MKKILTLLLLVIAVQVLGQTNPVTSITISLPANPDANMANWGSGISLFTITANAKATNGRVDGRVQESKILVSIKKGGAKICGSYTGNTAPGSNFNTLTKVWSGSNAVSLLGQNCTLPPGDYELSVQFFGTGPAGVVPFSEEKTRAFSVRRNEQLIYQPPQAISPVNGTLFSEPDIKKPITFRWTPVIPRPQEPVTYRLRVWQLMQGQNGVQAMRVNQPIITKDVDNLTQTIVNNLISGPCLPPYQCEFIWNIQAMDRDGKPIGGNNGLSELITFKFSSEGEPVAGPVLISPANQENIPAGQQAKFTWLPPKPVPSGQITYKIKIVEIIGDQSPELALRTNKPHFEKDSLIIASFEYLTSAKKFIAEKRYAWNVQAFNRERKPIGGNNGMSFPAQFLIGYLPLPMVAPRKD